MADDTPLLSFSTMEAALLRARRWLLLLPLAAAGMVGLFVATRARTFTTTVSFVPVVQGAGRGFSGLAQQFGITMPGQDPMASPSFYADVIATPAILRGLADAPYAVRQEQNRRSAKLGELYGIDGDSSEIISDVIDLLRNDILAVKADITTSIVRIKVRTKWPDVSEEISRKLLDSLNAYVARAHRGQAEAERTFTESRLSEAQAALYRAEDAVQSFLSRNREFRSDPALQTEYERLRREADLRQNVYTSLNQLFEQARIESVRNTPSITLVESPTRALSPDPRNLVLKMVVAAAVVFALVTSWLVIVNLMRGPAQVSSDELRILREAARRDFAFIGGLRQSRRDPREHIAVSE